MFGDAGSSSTTSTTRTTTTVDEESNDNSRTRIFVIIGLVIAAIGAMMLVYKYFPSRPGIPAMNLNLTPDPGVHNKKVSAVFTPKSKGEKLSFFAERLKDGQGIEYFNLVLRTPKGTAYFVPTSDGGLGQNDQVFRFDFVPDETGTYYVFPGLSKLPGADKKSDYPIEVKAPPVVSENKPSQKKEKTEVELLREEIVSLRESIAKRPAAALSAEDRRKITDAESRANAAEARAKAAELKIDGKVSSGEFEPVRTLATKTAETVKSHSEQMSRWQNLESDVASVKSEVRKVDQAIGTVLEEQSIQKQGMKAIAAVTDWNNQVAKGVVHAKTGKTFGFIGGKEVKDTKEFKKNSGIVNFDKQAEELASYIAEVERMAGRTQNVVAQAPEATNSKKMKKRQ